jgi:hypothetical protein
MIQQRSDTSKISFTQITLALEGTVGEIQEENLIHVHMISDTVYTHPELSLFTAPEILNR